MRVDLVKNRGNDRLAVFVLGWACGPELVEHIDPPNHDLLCVTDYRDIGAVLDGKDRSFARQIEDLLARYRTRTLIAWSFGVWAAERLLGPGGVIPVGFEKATALNGTPLPADDTSGIGGRRLAVTLRGIETAGMEPFDRKAYGSWYGMVKKSFPDRSLREKAEELRVLTRLSAVPYSPGLHWTQAIIGTADEIFPPENMLRYWGARAQTVPLPHYPFGDEKIVKELF